MEAMSISCWFLEVQRLTFKAEFVFARLGGIIDPQVVTQPFMDLFVVLVVDHTELMGGATSGLN